MRLVRVNIFETNSSSTHSLVMCTKETLDKWKNGEKFYIKDTDTFINKGKEFNNYIAKLIIYEKSNYSRTENGMVYEYNGVKYSSRDDMLTDDNIAGITDEEIQNYLNNNSDYYYDCPLSYDEFWGSVENYGYEGFEQTFTTPGKEEVVAFGYYGNDY